MCFVDNKLMGMFCTAVVTLMNGMYVPVDGMNGMHVPAAVDRERAAGRQAIAMIGCWPLTCKTHTCEYTIDSKSLVNEGTSICCTRVHLLLG